MATDQAQVKAPPASKYDNFVAEQLARAEQRIRMLDLTTALLGFLACTFAYAVLVILCDRYWQLSSPWRQAALVFYLLAAAVYLGFLVVRPLTRRINPYYAALQVEHTLPGAKNSVVNWLDLHDQRLAPAIRGALGQRAAKDLAKADLEKAISGRRAAYVAALAGVLAFTFGFLFLLFGPSQFSSLLRRAFAPFEGGPGIPTRTRLKMLRPEEGNAVVPSGRAVTVAVWVDGKIPDPKKDDAVKLHWRFDQKGPYQERLLQPQESAREWATVLSVADVREGFWYKVTGGDCETPEYQVTVRSAPALTDFQATYRYRPYVGRGEEVRRERKLEALRGTEVTLLVRTNRTIKNAQLLFENQAGRRPVPGERLAADPQAFQVKLVLDDSGLYRLSFQSNEEESYTDGLLHSVVAIPDRVPEVELTKPGQDVKLPVNSMLRLEGKASDDIGVKSLTLRIQPVGIKGLKFQPKPYRPDKSLALPSGGYPLSVEYKDFVELSKIQTEDGKPYILQPGMELEYWLEAADACDFPQPNIGQSKHFKVLLTPPEKNEKQQQEREQAQKEQQQHDKKQDEQLKKEDQQRQEEKKKQEEERKAQQQADPNQENGQENKPNEGAGDKKDNKQPNEQNQQDQQTRQQADKIKKELDKQDKGNSGQQNQGNQEKDDKGEAKGGAPKAGASKPNGQQEQGNEEKKGESKPQGQQGENGPSGQKKEGDKPGEQGNKGEGKEGGKPQPMQGNKGEGKDGDPNKGQPDHQAAEGKDEGKGQQGQQGQPGKESRPAEGKGGPAKNSDKQVGQEKTGGNQGQQEKAAEGKEGNASGKPMEQQAAGEKKGPPPAEAAGAEAKGSNQGGQNQETKAAAKDGSHKDPNDKGPQGSSKSAPENKTGQNLAQGEGKGENEKPPSEAGLKELAKKLGDMQSSDPARREQAQKDLQKIQEQAKDPAIKELAKKMLDDLRKREDQQIAQAKPLTPEQDPKSAQDKKGPQGGEGKGGGGKEGGEGKPKQGSGMGGQGEAKEGDKREQGMGNSGENPMNQGNQNPQNPKEGGGEKGTATAKGKGRPMPGETPGQGLKDPTGRNDNQPIIPTRETPLAPNQADPLSQKATETQLEDFKTKLDKKMLERLKMTEEARQQFLKNYADLVHRDQARPEIKEKPVDPRAATQLPSTSTQGPSNPATGSANDTAGPGQALPPPGFRDAWREFTKEIANQPKKPK